MQTVPMSARVNAGLFVCRYVQVTLVLCIHNINYVWVFIQVCALAVHVDRCVGMQTCMCADMYCIGMHVHRWAQIVHT